MADGSPEAIEFPDDEDITVVLAEVVQAFGELGALRLRAGFVVGEDADRAGLAECVLLQFGVLLESDWCGRWSDLGRLCRGALWSGTGTLDLNLERVCQHCHFESSTFHPLGSA